MGVLVEAFGFVILLGVLALLVRGGSSGALRGPALPQTDGIPLSAQANTHRISGPAYVIDGDSLRIAGRDLRLFGIDAPELDHPHGQQAKWALHRLCKDQTITAQIIGQDDYGRNVARCTLPDGRDVSAEMVRQGLAIDWPRYSQGQYRALETPDARRRLYLADARQKGRMHLWDAYAARKKRNAQG